MEPSDGHRESNAAANACRFHDLLQLDKALDEAQARGWAVVDMKQDRSVIFPFEKNSAAQCVPLGAMGLHLVPLPARW